MHNKARSAHKKMSGSLHTAHSIWAAYHAARQSHAGRFLAILKFQRGSDLGRWLLRSYKRNNRHGFDPQKLEKR
jgi:hypothetical protein